MGAPSAALSTLYTARSHHPNLLQPHCAPGWKHQVGIVQSSREWMLPKNQEPSRRMLPGISQKKMCCPKLQNW